MATVGDSVTTGPGSLTQRFHRLGLNSAVYLIGDAFFRGASLLMVPLYSRALTPDAYGILAVVLSVQFVAIVITNLSLDSAISRLSLDVETEEERRELYGSITAFLAVFGLAVLAAAEVLGQLGALDFFRSVPYDPYLRFAFWTAYLAAFTGIPISIYVSRQEPGKVLRLRMLNTLVWVASGITLVVILDQGVIGALRASLAGSAATAAVSLFLIAKLAAPRFSRSVVVTALLFSLPLVPHLLSHWLLSLSDRVVLQAYVSDAQLGLYSMGYTVGAIASLVTVAYSNAVMPMIVSHLKDPDKAGDVPRLGTYSFLALSGICLALALFGGTAIRVLTPPEYHGAAAIVPWIAFSYVLVAAYMIVNQGLWYTRRTGLIAIGTLIAGLINVGATMLLAPSLGITGAGVATVIGYAALVIVQAIFGQRAYPIRWEWDRGLMVLAAAAACVVIGLQAGTEVSVGSVALRCLVIVVLFPAVLGLLGFWRERERRWIRRHAAGMQAIVVARSRRFLALAVRNG